MAETQTLFPIRQHRRHAFLPQYPNPIAQPLRNPILEGVKAQLAFQTVQRLEAIPPEKWTKEQAFAWRQARMDAITAQGYANDPEACKRGYLR